MKNEEQARSLFGISLSDKPRWKQFLICSSGFFFGYLVNGVCEVFESFYSSPEFSSPILLPCRRGSVWLPRKLRAVRKKKKLQEYWCLKFLLFV